MNELKVFESAEFGSVRTVNVNGQPLFVASDVANALGYNNPRDAVARHCKGVVKRDTPTTSGIQSISYITEGDVYRLIMRSKLPTAEKFEDWVVNEVLPSIRKNGGYIAGQEQMTDEELMAKALLVAQNKIAEREAKIKELETSVKEMDKVIVQLAPKADYVDKILASEDCLTVTQIAIDYGMSAKKLNDILHRMEIQRRIGNQWILYARYLGKGYVKTRTHTFEKMNGQIKTKELTVWTQKGRMFLYEELKKAGYLPTMEVSA